MIQRENGLVNTTKEVIMRVSNNNLCDTWAEIQMVVEDLMNANYYLIECHKIKGKDFEYSVKFRSDKEGLKK